MLRENDTFKAYWIVSDFGNDFHKLTNHNLEILLAFLSDEEGRDLLQDLTLPCSFYNLTLGAKECLPFTHIFTIPSALEDGMEMTESGIHGLLVNGFKNDSSYEITYHLCFSMAELEDESYFFVEATESWIDGKVTLKEFSIQFTKCYKTLHQWKNIISSQKVFDLTAHSRYLPVR